MGVKVQAVPSGRVGRTHWLGCRSSMAISTPFSCSREAVYFWDTCLLFLALLSPGFFDNLRRQTCAEDQKQPRTEQKPAWQAVRLLSLAGQVVHAGPDVLVIGVDLDVEELGLGVEGSVCLLKPDQLGFPTLAVPPLVPDVL